jgi:hypothetical protein
LESTVHLNPPPMHWKAFLEKKVSPFLAFRTLPTTLLVSLIYVAIFSAVLVTDELPAVPRDRRGLDLEKAWADLHVVRAPSPFPKFPSRNSDCVFLFYFYCIIY